MKLNLRKISIMMACGVMALTVAACSTAPKEEVVVEQPVTESAFPVTVTDSTGVDITINAEPQRIVSLAPSTTEILYFIGAEDKIVGKTKYCDYPESIQDVESVGGTSDPNVETVIALEPDLVLASTHVSEEVISKLREVGIPVAFLNEQENFEGTYSAITKAGLLVGKSEEAEAVVADMEARVAAVAERIAKATESAELPKVYYMMWHGDSDSTAGGDTFIGEIIRLAGGENIAEDVSGWSISKELIAEGDPDIIIVPAGRDTLATINDIDFYKDLRAVQEGNVFEINDNTLSRQGPRLADALEDMAEIIHPEAE